MSLVYQVSASLDALTDIVGGKVNIHVLMALAAFASAFMGNPLEGGLLLAMFNLAHIGRQSKLPYLARTLCVCVCVCMGTCAHAACTNVYLETEF